ncbi:hypothetical protein F9B85_10925 [Heliorestis acidaminivorans]|uniref:Uncharacterized protein n=1 Tax=Heliorestis acidaminivorans TaxID=553427 RepID=A0A6I0EQU6_9FIRM|nr:DsrE family protein [Heliorestis acidaminivorans]KAB2951797.1 hypothetical protein F9B85_10925 [Heliorestis acidaminivorans]
MEKKKVIIHVNDMAGWMKMFTGLDNFLNDVGQEKAEVCVVVNGPGVCGCPTAINLENNAQALAKCGSNRPEKLMVQVRELHARGVTFIACRNALRKHFITEDMIESVFVLVNSSITEMIERQQEGYAYIKM